MLSGFRSCRARMCRSCARCRSVCARPGLATCRSSSAASSPPMTSMSSNSASLRPSLRPRISSSTRSWPALSSWSRPRPPCSPSKAFRCRRYAPARKFGSKGQICGHGSGGALPLDFPSRAFVRGVTWQKGGTNEYSFEPPDLRRRFHSGIVCGETGSQKVAWTARGPEAVIRSVPVIASRIGGFAETIEDEVSGLLFSNGDELALHRALERVATGTAFPSHLLDPEVVARVTRSFSIERHIANLRAHLHHVVDRSLLRSAMPR